LLVYTPRQDRDRGCDTPTARGKGSSLATIAQAVSTEIFDQFSERFECWNRGELDRMQAMYAEDAVFDVSAVFADVAPVRGHQSMRRIWDEVWEIWGGMRLDVLEAFDVGERRYAVNVRLWGKGRRSGAEVDQRLAFVYTLDPQEDRITRAQLLPDLAAALAVAESPASQRV
jgi:ketosteroid isomerase-like protein